MFDLNALYQLVHDIGNASKTDWPSKERPMILDPWQLALFKNDPTTARWIERLMQKDAIVISKFVEESDVEL